MKHSYFSLFPVFVAVFEEGSLSSAAKRLDITQSAVSQSLNKLRDLYEDSLFIRSASGVKPSALAVEIYPNLAEAVNRAEVTLPGKREFRAKESERIFSICSISVAGSNILPELSTIMAKQAPNSSVEVHPLSGKDLITDLRFQNYDLLLTSYPHLYPSLKSTQLFEEELVVVVRSDHPRIHHSISEQQFLVEKHVTHSQTANQSGFLETLNQAVLNKRQVAWKVAGILDSMPIVAKTDLISITTRSIAHRYVDTFDVKVLTIDFIPNKIDLYMLWHGSRSNEAAHRWFRQQLLMAASIVNT
ncbi:LysR family transcriptional regulator [Vibrio lamellibrachiae]|uniref:LysR family transcriptional regulator n=1 Tax=Vibrio lamellibrachiae TaxID=2910253 RepID=UPI003D0ADE3B